MDDDFEEYVRAYTPGLLRTAYLLTGDQHLAEDLVQSALARTHLAWRRLRRRESAPAYTRRTMYHLQIRRWQRRRFTETELPADVESTIDEGDRAAIRVDVRRALRMLPPRQRAVLVLRFYEDCTEAQAAEILGISVGTVKSQTSKALKRLRFLTSNALQEMGLR